jgi:hypothetical protein
MESRESGDSGDPGDPGDPGEAAYEQPQTQIPAALVGALLLQLIGSFVVRVMIAGFRRDRILEDF